MENLKSLGWDDSYEDKIDSTDKNRFDIARVIAEHKNSFIVKNDNYERRAVISGHFFHNTQKRSDMPVVGDWVLVNKDTPSVIQKIIPRRTCLIRKSPNDRKSIGKNSENEQALASNVDIVFIVTSLNQNFNLSRIERALVLIYGSGATPVILLSKSDLCETDINEKIRLVEGISFGVPIISFSNVSGLGIDEIKNFLTPGKTACLLGSSGVGKTSLINILCDKDEKTSEIRERDGTGRHATTGRSIYFMENGGIIIDTPGIREIGFLDNCNDLEKSYEDIEQLALSCKFNNCRHQTEPGCAIRAAIENGTLDERRFRNYLKIQKEISFYDDKETAMKNKHEKNKQIAKMIRKMDL